jgi:hypothetical protein
MKLVMRSSRTYLLPSPGFQTWAWTCEGEPPEDASGHLLLLERITISSRLAVNPEIETLLALTHFHSCFPQLGQNFKPGDRGVPQLPQNLGDELEEA